MSAPSERAHYRIQYPTAARPHIVIEGRSFGSFSSGDKVVGTVRFQRTEAVDVMGSVVRVGGREVAVKLEVGVPLRIVIEEQRFLREHHRGMPQ